MIQKLTGHGAVVCALSYHPHEVRYLCACTAELCLPGRGVRGVLFVAVVSWVTYSATHKCPLGVVWVVAFLECTDVGGGRDNKGTFRMKETLCVLKVLYSCPCLFLVCSQACFLSASVDGVVCVWSASQPPMEVE